MLYFFLLSALLLIYWRHAMLYRGRTEHHWLSSWLNKTCGAAKKNINSAKFWFSLCWCYFYNLLCSNTPSETKSLSFVDPSAFAVLCCVGRHCCLVCFCVLCSARRTKKVLNERYKNSHAPIVLLLSLFLYSLFTSHCLSFSIFFRQTQTHAYNVPNESNETLFRWKVCVSFRACYYNKRPSQLCYTSDRGR